MIKVRSIWKSLLKTPVTFWVSLLVSSAVVNCLPFQAKADEVQGTVVISSVPQEEAAVDASTEPQALGDVSSVAESTSKKGDIDTYKIQSAVAIPPTITVETSAEVPTLGDVPSVTELSSDEGDIDTNDPMPQVTNVSELRDVSPGDWAYEALRKRSMPSGLSLVERYGCIAGYPDGTYRGNRITSRFEFAAGLNACLQQIEKLIATSSAEFVTKEDLATLQRLSDEFKTELSTLGTRVDKLEGRVAVMEDRQFSTTTKLRGLAWFNLTGAFADGDVKVETTDLNGINGDLAVRPAGRENGKPAVYLPTFQYQTNFRTDWRCDW